VAELSASSVVQVLNPWDGSVVGEVPAATEDVIDTAIATAEARLDEVHPVPVYRRTRPVL
jgi:acyl-CoA reductase-like NAD-dependent aldehyde dehydrogenase